MLAYIFWHWPRDEVERSHYEEALVEFHRRLGQVGVPGFRGSVVAVADDVPWLGGRRAYEDVHIVDGSAALDPLNEAAVSDNRQEAHARVARLYGGGAGALYGLQRGSAAAGSPVATWFGKPRDMSYQDLYGAMGPLVEQADGGLWRRQMVLGPAPEFCLMGPLAVALPLGMVGVSLRRSIVWAGFVEDGEA